MKIKISMCLCCKGKGYHHDMVGSKPCVECKGTGKIIK